MKDPNYIPHWAEEVAHRLHIHDDDDIANENRPFVQNNRLPTPSTMPAEIDPKRSRSPARNIAQLRDLSASAILMLFTPVMVPPGFHIHQEKSDTKPSEEVSTPTLNASSKITTDPFEVLGKAFSKHHRRIRHVPYVPAVGFTETHEAFLAQADAVVLVSCGPHEQHSPSIKVESTTKDDSDTLLAKQAQFAHDASLALAEIVGDRTDRNVPMINFHFGDDQWPDQVTEYLNVWAGERYSKESVARIVELVFGDGDGDGAGRA
ncbi:hypothetical protein KC332_g16840 [Hortaea werneckii]|uniref:Glycoside hydrolase family 3 C-terminal domain-containing protein n=1 Tax=Hortaea werneckii EXF-2000 TaxID=1157616 RepID=A0A1Z5TQS5_HORWE|nr:hypothetical protein KC358_g16028 [Hortaea werneckii]OTA38387.1 hypothetical protein BTJ68_01792 [Hortaea werneckii EXF-2000]KAI6801057.1 hypothetical protein KC350_g15731 [Hortaea werneckii]KAI6922582.1 hypothetical protein KC341_g15301 [Hortaea werneckii]KAI6937623.1 hypothetical protein KC348_g5707 [Hortaea werneckii]